MEIYTGIDLGKKKADITIINSKGEIKAQSRVNANIAEVV
jgi:hypothetical protein